MGSGKTSIGSRLAARLGLRYVDNDETLWHRTGRTARQLAACDGIDRVHAEEAAALLDALARPDPSVIGAAASVVESARVREAHGEHIVVWLDRDVALLAAKLRRKEHRPYPERDPLELLREQRARRAPLYREVADVVVDPGERSKDDVAALIATEIARLVQ